MNMKKTIIGMGVVVLSAFCLTVKAQNITTTGNTTLSNNLLSNVSPWTLDDIYKIGINYCNKDIKWDTTNSYLTIGMRPGQAKNLCITFINTSEHHQDLIVGFTESIINSGWKQLCNWDLANKSNAFYKLIDLKYTDIGLSGNNWTFTQTARIRIPKNTTWGDIYGCIWFYLSWAYFKWPNDVLGVRVARHFPMKITVTWAVYNLWRRDDMKDAYTTNRSGILKIIIAILALWLIVTIVQTSKKKEEHPKQKHKKQ
jgi:hypothetical protein